MRLKKFRTDVFAGINNRELEFTDGLNIILGKNEAGKSTIINAIYATLFKEPKIRLNYRADTEFYEMFFPYPEGDYIHGCLDLEIDGDKYKIEKEWSRDNPTVYLELPDGQRLQSQAKINNYKRELLYYGKSTYNNIVFTKQSEIKSAIKQISGNDQVISTVSNFLRRAVMELDGVSIDRLNKKIDTELDRLLKKWDFENNRPSNPNRDENNPYKRGYGNIYKAYIKKERSRQNVKKAKRIEEEFEEVSSSLKDLKDRKTTIDQKIDKLAEIEDDIFTRGQIQPELKSLNDKVEEMKKVNKKWPVLEENLKEEKKNLQELNEELKGLIEEKKQAQKYKEKIELENKIEKIDEKKKQIDELKEKADEIGEIGKEDVDKLSSFKNKITNTRASLEAARLTARIKQSTADKIKVTCGVEEEQELDSEVELRADGYIRIKTDNIDIEVQSEEIDFAKLQKEYKAAHEKFDSLLEELEVENPTEARSKLNRLRDVKKEISNTQKNVDEILDGKEYDQLKIRLEEFDIEDEIRPSEEVEADIEELRGDKINNLKINIRTKEEKLKEWQEKYDSHDELFDKLIDVRGDIKENKNKLEELAELPDEFDSPAEFKSHLSNLRRKKNNLDQQLRNRKEEMIDVKNRLPENSHEELKTIFQDRKAEYEKLVSKAEKIRKIKEKFNEKLEEMDKNSFTPLVESFSNYLSELTAENYEVGKISDDFEVKVKNKDKAIPASIDLLSYGTYDGVALALRLALLENLFDQKRGFLVLDDCLVNLDPERTEKAVNLINSFKEDYQVIFTTCDPDTADMLGGNIIEM